MLTIYRGDDVAFSNIDRRVCVNIRTFDDLTGWNATFTLFDNRKAFPDISSGLFTFGYSSAETMAFPLGKTFANLTIFDSKGQTRAIKRVEVEVQDRIPISDCGSITVSADMVISDYNLLGHVPTINGKPVKGDHDSHYFGLADEGDMEGVTALVAVHSGQISEIREQGERNAASIAEQGVSIAKNAQSIQGQKQTIKRLSDDVEDIKAKSRDFDEAIARAVNHESCERRAADNALSTRLDEETTARLAGDRSVREALDAERAERIEAVSANAQAVANESTVREAGDKTLADTIESEAAKRESGDKKLGDQLRTAKESFETRADEIDARVADVRADLTADIQREAQFREQSDDLLKRRIEETDASLKAAVEAEAASRKEADEREARSRENADRKLGVKLHAEIHAREFTDSTLAAEGVTRAREDAKLDAKIVTETENRTSEDARVLAEAKEYADKIGARALQFKGSKEFYRELLEVENPKIGDMWNVEKNDDGTPLGANFAWDGSKWDKLSETIDLTPYALKTEVQAEKAAREAADAALRTAISDEAARRESEDAGIRAALEQEAVDRTNADTTIQSNLDLEVQNRISDVNNARSYTDAKAEELRAADATLQAHIDETNANLRSELNARIAGDAALGERIDNEKEARLGGDRTLDERITYEKGESVRREAIIAKSVSDEAAKRESEDRRVLVEAKEYADTVGAKAMHFKGTLPDRAALEAIENPASGDMYNVLEYVYDDGKVVKGANFAWSGTKWDKLSETIDLSPYALKTEVQDEKAAREAADAALATAVADEEDARKEADREEAQTRKDADDGLGDRISQETVERGNADDALRTAIGNEVTDRETAVANERAYADAKVAELKADDATLQAHIDETNGNLRNEENARVLADNALGVRIDDEKLAREEGDATEKRNRETADNLIYSKIEVEKQAAVTREGEISTALAKEITDRASADAAEKTAREQADANESASRESADTALGGRIDAERTDAIEREGVISQAVADETTTRTTEDARVLEEAKAYADTVGAKAMHFCGTVADRAALEAIADPQLGDMYNVLRYVYDDGKVVEGANFAWGKTGWDKLSETIDLTPYARHEEVTSAVADFNAKFATLNAALVEVRQSVATEASARETADAGIRTLVSNETIRAQGREAELDTAVAAEESRAMGAESDIRQSVADESQSRIQGDADTLVAAKAYCDEHHEEIASLRRDVLKNAQDIATNAEAIAHWQTQIEENQRRIDENATAIAAETRDRTLGDEQTLIAAKAYADALIGRFFGDITEEGAANLKLRLGDKTYRVSVMLEEDENPTLVVDDGASE